jgi:hypothetical protein
MEKFLERLRQKPYHTRVSISILTASGITAVIALVWVVSFFASIKGADTLIQDSAPLSKLGEKLSEGADLTKELFESLEELQQATSTDAVVVSSPTTTPSVEEIPSTSGGEDVSVVELPAQASTTPEEQPVKKSEPRFEDGVEVVEI